MAFERGLELLERAAERLRSPEGSSRERLMAAWPELDALGNDAAVPAGILTEIADTRRRLGTGDGIRQLSDQECQQEADRVITWAEILREVMQNGAIGDSSPGELPEGAGQARRP